MGQAHVALKYHEAHMSLAHSSGDKEQEERAVNQLWRVYMKMADESERSNDLHNACLFLEKSLKNAKQLKDMDMISTSLFKLGNCYKALQDFDRAIGYQNEYTQVCEEMSDLQGKSDALCALGELYENRGDINRAIKTYKSFLQCAEESGDENRISQACDKIGITFSQLGNYEESVTYFERGFELALKSKDHKRIGEAKVRLGFAKGNANMMSKMMSFSK